MNRDMKSLSVILGEQFNKNITDGGSISKVILLITDFEIAAEVTLSSSFLNIFP